jgi:hypothetical protein
MGLVEILVGLIILQVLLTSIVCLWAVRYLQRAVASNNHTSMTVVDSWQFQDGDRFRVGGDTFRVMKVEGNTLTVERAPRPRPPHPSMRT